MKIKSNNQRFILGLTVSTVLLTSTAVFSGPITNPYVVNTYTTGIQGGRPSVSMGASGDHVVIYRDAERNAVFARQYNANGSPIYNSEQPAGVQSYYSSSMDGNGNYVVLTTADDGSGNGVYATVFNKYGNIIVNQFRVNSSITGNQEGQDVEMNRNGDFVVTWTGENATGTYEAYAKRYNNNAVPLTADIKVSNTLTSDSSQHAMGVAMDEQGAFAITYVIAYQSISNSTDVWARKYDQYGSALTNPFRVNTTTPGSQAGSDIAMDAYGNFMVTWESYSDVDAHGVYAQRYNSSAVKIGSEFLVNSNITDMQRYSSVSMGADGSSVVTWVQWNPTNPVGFDIYAREFDASGGARGDQFQVNTSISTDNYWPKASMDACGYYMIAWEGKNANGDEDIYARRYAAANPSAAPCLANGKTVSNLSNTAGNWKYFKISVPVGKSLIDIQQWGPSYGDADLYVRYGGLPTLTQYHFRPYVNGNTERVTYQYPPAGDWYIGVYGFDNYSSVNINAQYY